MKLAMAAAGFSVGEADNLRRILSHKRAEELLEPFRERFRKGCLERGYPAEFAETCFRQFRGFAHYGFPESHAASFALIAYASAYLKRYYPAAFTAALLNSQPMGFYAPHTLVEDARRHGVEVRPLEVGRSGWDCTLEPGDPGPALRLGLRLVRGLSQAAGKRIEAARGEGYRSLGDLARRARLPRHELCRLALAGALRSLSGGRREALWEIQALGPLEEEDLFYGLPMDSTPAQLPPLSELERLWADYQATGLSLEQHPLALLRPLLSQKGALSARELSRVRAGQQAAVGGMVIVRQRPPTAKGFTFLSLEDETGISNLIVEPQRFERFRPELTRSVFLYAEGRVERSGKLVNLKVRRLESLSLGAASQPLRPRSWH